jgi:putative membrane protein
MEEKKSDINPKSFNRTDHFANERTFLAWIRTNLGIMAFGFVIEKFSIFINQIGSFLGRPETSTIPSKAEMQKVSSLYGIVLIGVGALLCLIAFWNYKKKEKEIMENTYTSPMVLQGALALFVFSIGVFLVLYLIFAPT